MRHSIPTLLATLLLIFALPDMAAAQSEGDYRSAANGDWSAAATWQTYTGGAWGAAVTAPTGAETIWITNDDSVSVDVAVSVTGTVITDMTGVLETGAGSLTFEDGSTYEHARDAGEVPAAIWASGSTALFTGIETDAPDNRGQDYHHLTINSPGMLSNEDFDLGGNTIGGDVHVINSGSARVRLIGGEDGTITLMGDVIVEADAQLETLGTGSPVNVTVNHWGDITVNGGAFSVSRGSQGSGTGTTTWNLLMGDLTMTNAETRNSNPTPGNAKLVFAAADTQRVSFTNVEYGGGNVHFAVSDSTTLEVAGGFEANGLFVNEGEVIALGDMTFLDESTYEHARDAGSVPSAIWAEGSTALFTGLETDAPDNRGQDYWNLTIDSPNLAGNEDFDLGGNTIGGNLHVMSSGARIRLIGGESGTITIMGDVIVDADGQLETQGTGSQTDVVVDHHGSVFVNGGAFSVSRGSQASGTGTTTWNLHAGDMTFTDASTRNSNPTPGNAVFVYTGTDVQTLTIDGSTEDIENLSIRVAPDAMLDLGTSTIVGGGVFWVDAGGTVMTAHEAGLDGALALAGDGDVDFDVDSHLTFNGATAQEAGAATPDSLGSITFDNAVMVSLTDTTSANVLFVPAGATLVADTTGSILVNGGMVDGTVIVRGEVLTTDGGSIDFGSTGVYEHDRDEGEMPSGVWAEGSTAVLTGLEADMPANRGQDYWNLTVDSPDMISNLDLDLGGNTVSGDLHAVNTGLSRLRLIGGEDGTITLMGDVIVEENAQLETLGTGSPTTVVVNHYGSVMVNGGAFSVSRGSQGSGTGTTTWNLFEGDMSLTDVDTRNSNPTPGNAKFVFAAGGTQTLTIDGSLEDIDDLPIAVSDSTSLDVGTSEIVGGDVFIMEEGATLITAHADGVAGTVQTEGDVGIQEGTSFTFNGTEAQVTSALMPGVVANLTIDNASGVTLSQVTIINGELRLLNGVFDNTIPFTLAVDAEIIMDGGSLLIGIANEEVAGGDVPTEFALHQNYPNPFNPSTVIRYDIREQANVTVTVYDVMGREVTRLVDRNQSPGKYSVEWNASGLASGTYYYRIEAGNWAATRSLLLIK